MPKAKKAKHIPVPRHWSKDIKNERKNIIKAIIKGRKAGLTWNKVSQDIYNRGNIYISPSALQQRWTHYFHHVNKPVVTELVPVGGPPSSYTVGGGIQPKTSDHLALVKMVKGIKAKVNELDEQFTKAFAGVIKLEKVIKNLRNEVNSLREACEII
jgi:hypothetical protein